MLDAVKEGHGSGQVGVGGKRVDENVEREGIGRWVCEESCVDKADCFGKVI